MNALAILLNSTGVGKRFSWRGALTIQELPEVRIDHFKGGQLLSIAKAEGQRLKSCNNFLSCRITGL